MTSEENGQRIHLEKINFLLFAFEAGMVAGEGVGEVRICFGSASWLQPLCSALVLLLALVILDLPSSSSQEGSRRFQET